MHFEKILKDDFEGKTSRNKCLKWMLVEVRVQMCKRWEGTLRDAGLES